MPAPLTLLFVGDPHATADDLDDCQALVDLAGDVAVRERAVVVWAGDLYHTHAVIHAEVQRFWWENFRRSKARGIDEIVIRGNHDGPTNPESRATALLAHCDQVTVVRGEPYELGGVLFCPYAHSAAQLFAAATTARERCKTLICHQTFDGSTYENGFFAGDGVDPELIPQARIISGHIHKPQEFGKVWYPGSPRWRTLDDANEERAVWLLQFEGGVLVDRKPVSTGDACRRILRKVDTPANPYDVDQRPAAKDELHVDVRGPRAWAMARLPLYDGWARAKPTFTDAPERLQVRESEGIGQEFMRYVDAYEPKRGTDKAKLRRLAEDGIRGVQE